MQKKSATMIDRNAREGTGFVITTIILLYLEGKMIIIITSCRKSMMIHMDTLRIALQRMCR